MEPAPATPPEQLPRRQPRSVLFVVRHGKKVLRNSHIVILEIVACFALLFAVAAGFLVWRLASGPVDMGFARNYIQEALRIPEQGLTPTVGDIVLSWPDLNGPLLLGFKNAKIFNAQGKPVIAIDEAALSLSKARLLIGQISPVALIVRAPVVKVSRLRSGRIVFGVVGLEAEPDSYGPHAETEKSAFERIVRFIARPGREHTGLGTLEAFKIEGAKLIMEDKTLNSSWVLPRMDANFESRAEGLSAELDLQFSENDPTAFLKMNLTTPWDTQETQMKTELKNFDPWFFAQRLPQIENLQKGDVILNGQIAAILDKELKPVKMVAEVSSPAGKISNADVSKDPITYKNFVAKTAYDGTKSKLVIDETKITVNGITVHAKGSLDATPQKITGPIRLEIAKIAHKDIKPLWPPMLEGRNSQEWILNKLSQGTFTDLFAEIHINGMKSDEGWIFGIPNIIAGFSFEGMKVDYRPPLYPVTQGKGKGTFELAHDRLDLDIESGKLADMDVGAGKIAVMDVLAKGKGSADIQLPLKGPLATGLKYVALEPIHMKQKFDPAKVKGNADLKIGLQMPTHKGVKFSEVKIAIDGTLNNVFLPAIVKDFDLTGGPLDLHIKDNDLAVKGKGALNGRAASFEYKEFLKSDGQPYKFKIAANLDTDEAMREGLGIGLQDYLQGPVTADVDYTEHQDGRADIALSGDLTPSTLFIHAFDYEKKPGAEGKVALKAKMQDGVIKEVSNLEMTGPELALKKAELSFREKDKKATLAKGTIGDFTIGASKGSMNFTVAESGQYRVKADSSFFDLRPFVNAKKRTKPYDNPPLLIELTAATLLGDDEKKLPPGRFLIDLDEQGLYNRMEVDAVAGKGKVTLRLAPDENGVRAFALNAEDAGAMLSAFGIYKNMRGGVMTIKGKAKSPGDRNMEGKAQVTDFVVVNAPVLAQLISAISLPGLASLLGGEGLGFSKLEADYHWRSKAGGSLLEIKDGATSGNSVGFSFEGKINLADSTVDISGTVVPLSDINKFIQKIPLVGDILTGGSGLIAATYSVRGPAEKPGVMVNPLSVLAPGILRRILFE